jgi:hypothetical protein
MGRPAIGASGFPGKRDDAWRAGITARTFGLLDAECAMRFLQPFVAADN